MLFWALFVKCTGLLRLFRRLRKVSRPAWVIGPAATKLFDDVYGANDLERGIGRFRRKDHIA
jgi:hypothetical protein